MACLCAVESLSSCRKQNAGLFIEKYQRKIKEDDKKDDKPIQGMINTIIRILNYVATFLQLVYSIFLSVIHILKQAHVLFKLNPWTYEGDRGGCQPLF